MSTVNYMTGFRPPLREVSRFLRERGVLFYLDGTQSLGALEFDAREVQPDMLAVHGYKWLLSPNGAAFFYIHPRLRESLPPSVVGWRSHVDWRSVDHLHHGAPQFNSSAEKYEGGMLVFPVLYAMAESVRMILEIGPAVIETRVLELAAYTRERLRALGASFPEERASPAYRECFASPIVAARFNGVDPSVVARRLREQHVLVSARHGNLRISTHFYNNEADVDCLERELRALLAAA
jgi:selenocysteine lyase/cysteine desulfurase